VAKFPAKRAAREDAAGHTLYTGDTIKDDKENVFDSGI
jgi:hypothetical protein